MTPVPKALLRAKASRTRDALWNSIGSVVVRARKRECPPNSGVV
jgi:hypothetical protein